MPASIIAKLLSWTGLPQWALELIAVGLVVIALMFYHHHVVNVGVAEQQAADDKASAKLVADAKAKSDVLESKAQTAEHSHDQELADLRAYQLAHASSAVRLCDAHGSGQGVPQAGIKIDSAAGSAAVSVQPVSPGDSGSGQGAAGVDIGPMLSALAASADTVSADDREAQSRYTDLAGALK